MFIGREVRDSAGPEGIRAYLRGHFFWPNRRPRKSCSTATSRTKKWQASETLPAVACRSNPPFLLTDLPDCQALRNPTDDCDPPTPAEKPANLTALQLQLLDLATRSKPVPVDRSQELEAQCW